MKDYDCLMDCGCLMEHPLVDRLLKPRSPENRLGSYCDLSDGGPTILDRGTNAMIGCDFHSATSCCGHDSSLTCLSVRIGDIDQNYTQCQTGNLNIKNHTE